MVTLLLGLIACILLFGPFGLVVFTGIMICILPIYLVYHFMRMILDHRKKYRRKHKVVVETQRGKVTLLYKDGKMGGCRPETKKLLDWRKPMKKLSELIKECREKGIPIQDDAKVSKEDLIRKLANYHLEQNPGDIPSLEQVSPQLARDITELPEKEREEVLKSDRFACGEKKNGIRGILHIRPEGNRFTSRNRCSNTYLLNELTENVPHLCSLDLGQWEGSIFDGELYIPDNFIKLDSFANALEATTALLHCSPEKAREFQETTGQRIHYHIFDVIRAEGKDLRPVSFKDRLEYLNEFKGYIKSSGRNQFIEFEDLIFKDKEQYFKEIIKAGGEGIVLKDLEAPYFPGARSSSWLKLKRSNTVDAIDHWL